MNEDSISMVNAEQYLLRCRLKRLPKTGLYYLPVFFMYMSFEDEKKKPNFTTNAAFRFVWDTVQYLQYLQG